MSSGVDKKCSVIDTSVVHVASNTNSCACEGAKLKELYDEFYGNYEDHLGRRLAEQRGKMPVLKGPKLWMPEWMNFISKSKIDSTKEMIQKEMKNDLQVPTQSGIVEELDIYRSEDAVELCKCGDACYTASRQVNEATTSNNKKSPDEFVRRKSKKKESILIKNIIHNTILTPSVVLARLEHKMKPDITPIFISLLTFIQIGIKALRVKIQRFKHSSRLAAINFSGSRKNIISNLNDVFISVMMYSGCCYQIYAKGEDDVRLVPPDNQGPFIICFTALSADIENLDCGLDCGTIFSIYKRDPKLSPFAPRTANFSYKYLVSSGFALYSSCTRLVISVGKKLFSFTLDPVVKEFILNDDNIKIPDKGTHISVDEGHSGLWEPQILEYMKRKKDPKLGKPLRTRTLGSLVADFHRILYLGGIYLYPANRKNPQGKTTLLCECVPLAHIADLAGGAASTGKSDVLKTDADQLGQYIPLFIGSKSEVQELLLITSSPGRG